MAKREHNPVTAALAGVANEGVNTPGPIGNANLALAEQAVSIRQQAVEGLLADKATLQQQINSIDETLNRLGDNSTAGAVPVAATAATAVRVKRAYTKKGDKSNMTQTVLGVIVKHYDKNAERRGLKMGEITNLASKIDPDLNTAKVGNCLQGLRKGNKIVYSPGEGQGGKGGFYRPA